MNMKTPSVANDHNFKKIIQSLVPTLPSHLTCVIGIDPGETTGIAVFIDAVLIDTYQIDHRSHKDIGKAAVDISMVLNVHKPSHVIIEDYRVYKWKTKSHANSDLFTSRLIGSLEYVCSNNNYPMTKQMASIAKGFMTDSKLRSWGFWIKGKKHTRDAIRHAATYLMFQAKRYKQENLNGPNKNKSG